MDASAKLIGRERELATLDQALERLPGAAAIEGEPGIGKSRLLAELSRRSNSLGARASEAEMDLPYAVFAEALEPGLRDRRIERLGLNDPDALDAVLDPLASHEAPDRHRVHRALRDLLAALARTEPLVFWLDDVQWADPASADALAALLRRPPDARVLVAFAVREGQAPRTVTAAVAAAMRDSTLVHIAPRPLDREQAAKLVGAAAEAVYADSGGNPFYLEQLARRHGPASGHVHLEGVPDRVAAALASELDALSPPARVLLDAAAVAGDPFDLPLAARVAELEDAAAALDELVDRTLVRSDAPGRFAFRHPVVRRAVYDVARPAWRMAAHARAAAALRERGASAVALAHHVEYAAAPGDEDAIALLETAASGLQATAPPSAARLRAAALRLLPDDDRDRRSAMTVALADAQNAAGEPSEARATLLALMDGAEGEERTALAVRVANVEYWVGYHDDARRRLQVALQTLPAEPSPDRIRLHLGVGLSMLMSQHFEESVAHASDARDDARAIGDPVLEAAALALAALAATARNPADPAPADAGGAAFAALNDSQILVRLPGLWMLARANRVLGRFPLALEQLERGTRLARASGRSGVALVLRAEAASVLVELGRLEEAVDAAEEASDRASLRGGPVLLWALSVLSSARLQRGEATGALAAADEAASLGQRADFQAAGQPGWARGNALAATGHAAEGAEALARALDEVPPSERPAVIADLVDAGEKPDLAAAGEARSAIGDALIARAEAQLLLAAGDARAAVQRAAAAQLDGAPLAAARARLVEGQALATAGNRSAARAALTDAAEAFEAMGAERWRGMAARELRGLGHRVARRTAGEPGALTERERSIAVLAADGRTNREIATELVLSVKTVEAHMRNIFRKLGVSKRIELARGGIPFRE
ncbi:MAG: AAA family ATPase [Solirubrobacteraceae bacterium]